MIGEGGMSEIERNLPLPPPYFDKNLFRSGSFVFMGSGKEGWSVDLSKIVAEEIPKFAKTVASTSKLNE